MIELLLLTGFVLLAFNVNRYLHIMQQAFYDFTDYMPTLKNTRKLGINVSEIFLFVLFILALITKSNAIYIMWGIVAIISFIYEIKNKPQAKKKFNITKRVKIIYTLLYLILSAMILVVVMGISRKNYVPYYILFALLSLNKHFAILMVAIANALAKPINSLFNRKYINEAKKILKEKPDMKIIGITGSYGKTSTKNIVSAILSEKYNTVMTPKSYNTTLGVVKSIRENIRPYTEVFVCEMGASRLNDIKKICNIVKPDYSIITSIGPQHLMTFKSIENVEKGKFEIVTNSKDNALSVLNIDNEYIEDGIKKYMGSKKYITYSLNNKKADYHVEDISIDETGSSFKIVGKDETYNIETRLLGKHNIYNIVCAVAIAHHMKIEKEKIEKAVKKLAPVEHRLELKKMQNILVLDDSFNSNPDGSKYAIETLLMFKDKYKVLVTPGMIELGEKTYELNKKLGEYALGCDYVILVGQKTTKPIEDALMENNYTNYIKVKDIYEAFIKLNEIKNKHRDMLALIENDLTDSYS